MPVSASSAGSCFCAHSVQGCTDTMNLSWLPLKRFQSKPAADAVAASGATAAAASTARRVRRVYMALSLPYSETPTTIVTLGFTVADLASAFIVDRTHAGVGFATHVETGKMARVNDSVQKGHSALSI